MQTTVTVCAPCNTPLVSAGDSPCPEAAAMAATNQRPPCKLVCSQPQGSTHKKLAHTGKISTASMPFCLQRHQNKHIANHWALCDSCNASVCTDMSHAVVCISNIWHVYGMHSSCCAPTQAWLTWPKYACGRVPGMYTEA